MTPAPSICFERVLSTEYEMSHVTDKRSSPLWFPVVFARIENLTSFSTFVLRLSVLFPLKLQDVK